MSSRFLMLLVVLLSFLFLTRPLATSAQTDCTQQNVQTWLRERNHLFTKLEAFDSNQYVETLLLIQEVRRGVEDLVRPSCLDKLYIVNIQLLDSYADGFALAINGDFDTYKQVIEPRTDKFTKENEKLFREVGNYVDGDPLPDSSVEEIASSNDTSSGPTGTDEFNWVGDHDQVIGPIKIPSGLYRATAFTENYLTVELNPTTGECGEGTGRYLSRMIFAIARPSSDEGEEALITSQGCEALISIGATTGPWGLTFERIGDAP